MFEKAKNKITILGSGTSTGVPVITCPCSVCHSSDPKDKRMRMSLFLETAQHKNILIDTSPDLRSQLLREKITHIDAVIITHAHADHIHGIDDLRAFTFNREAPLPVYASKETINLLKIRFAYIFDPFTVFKDGKAPGGKIAKLELIEILPQTSTQILGENFYFDELPHGDMKTLSFIHKGFAYLTDGSVIPELYLKKLKDAELTLALIDCAAKNKHKTHLHLDLSVEYAEKINAKQSYLIHLSHVYSHNTLENILQNRNTISVSFDGQKIHY